ncbi:MAG: family 1 encapsulin nanocompartment shell protein [Acidimicrobiia bacterium]
MNHLHRDLAPVSSEAWAAVDEEVRRSLTTFLAGRRLVGFSGPHGWSMSSVDLGRTGPAHEVPGAGVQVAVRRSQPLLELRRPFTVAWTELDAIDRGATAVDLDDAVAAARSIALVEDALVFRGMDATETVGVLEASPYDALAVDPDPAQFPHAVARALAMLRDRGVDGPYAMAVGTRMDTDLVEGAQVGYPVVEHLRMLLDGPVLWTPAVDGAVVVSRRGGDFELVVGEDLSVGYRSHDADGVTFAVEETLLFRVNGPEAAIGLAFAPGA